MNSYFQLITLMAVFICCAPMRANCQGTFGNLDFESANLPPIPPNQSGGLVSIANGFPVWAGYLGADPVSQVRHNELAVGSASLTILGPIASSESILQGSYTAVLQAGLVGPFGNQTLSPASIAQFGLVPADTQTLFLRTGLGARDFTVTVGGFAVPMVEMPGGSNYRFWVGNISLYANTASELRITALSSASLPFNNLFLDAVEFSQQQIPEPSALCLLGLGTIILGRACLRKRP